VALVASLLTIPVAGTALYIMDEYLNTRSLSAPAVLFILINTVEKKFLRAAAWAVFTAAIHPLMAVFGLSYAALVWWMQLDKKHATRRISQAALLLLPFGFFPPVTSAYREVLATRPYFFLLRWHWYEWLGIFAPLALLWWFREIAKKRGLPVLGLLCGALILFELVYFVAALVVTIPPQLMNFAELQPMRSLHLLYIFLFIFSGGLLAQFILKGQAWRWLLLFVPLCAGMGWSQRTLFPATPHIEWPGAASNNDWVEAFVWVREHTPVDAYFALNPEHMKLPGEDQHGFRAMAERSMLADAVKDSGAVTMFPKIAETWQQQVGAQSGWKNFGVEDFRRLKGRFGVDWVVLQQPGIADMNCPYQNRSVLVCRID
jgi:hypothetical protein